VTANGRLALPRDAFPVCISGFACACLRDRSGERLDVSKTRRPNKTSSAGAGGEGSLAHHNCDWRGVLVLRQPARTRQPASGTTPNESGTGRRCRNVAKARLAEKEEIDKLEVEF
jgi:hypothetical protein